MKSSNCSGCGNPYPIVNKKYNLCQSCNWKRLHPGEKPKTYALKRTPIQRSTTPIKKRSASSRKTVQSDELVYKKVFDRHMEATSGNCKCEECGTKLSDDFKDESGKIIQRFRYSHILSKGAYPEFRHKVENFNILCFKCHEQWEFGDKKAMAIYDSNHKVIEKLFEERNK